MEFGGQKVTLKHLENLTKLIGQTFINSHAKFNTKQMQISLFNLRKTTNCIHTSRNTIVFVSIEPNELGNYVVGLIFL